MSKTALGATLSAYEPALMRIWADAEMDLLGEADRAGVPVLRACLGGQLLARSA